MTPRPPGRVPCGRNRSPSSRQRGRTPAASGLRARGGTHPRSRAQSSASSSRPRLVGREPRAAEEREELELAAGVVGALGRRAVRARRRTRGRTPRRRPSGGPAGTGRPRSCPRTERSATVPPNSALVARRRARRRRSRRERLASSSSSSARAPSSRERLGERVDLVERLGCRRREPSESSRHRSGELGAAASRGERSSRSSSLSVIQLAIVLAPAAVLLAARARRRTRRGQRRARLERRRRRPSRAEGMPSATVQRRAVVDAAPDARLLGEMRHRCRSPRRRPPRPATCARSARAGCRPRARPSRAAAVSGGSTSSGITSCTTAG